MQFIRSELSSLSSTLVDLSVFTICSSVFHFSITISTSAGVILGGVVNFLMNRNFAFKSFEQKRSHQVGRYLIVWVGSLLLNTYGTHLFVDIFGLNKFVGRLGVGLIVRFVWNFPLLKYFVFKK